jgi:hypothetical protein
MNRYMSLVLACAVSAPFGVGDADAATKKKNKSAGPQVFGFVQTAPVIGGTISNSNPYGERRFLNYRDNTQKFFGRISEKSPG